MRHTNLKFYSLLVLFSFAFLIYFPARLEASIVLKLIAANPSKTQTQRVTIKSYLPKETKPEDILDKGDLEVTYDTQQGSYFVFGEYDLKPGETLEKDIELKDIWAIPTNEIESLRLEMIKLEKLLKATEFAERAEFLKSSIDGKLNQISDNQSNPPANPERHISDYRENLKILESAKADMTLVRGLLSQAKTFPTVMIWRMILAIVIFLGILGISFYFIWSKQLKTIGETFPSGQEEAPAKANSQEPSFHQAEAEKKSASNEDMEKIIKKEEKKE
ncbi:MAG: hypothetical protein PHN59_06055 [Candidatus Omnitrophica bacterium]|nr:hypothetical protein [Candidatus Omnitrophota bacterium]